MGFKVSKPQENKGAANGARVAIWLVILLALWGVQQAAAPAFIPCESCDGTGATSCGAESCRHGYERCSGNCLKADDPGWTHMTVKGHGPEELWMRFDHPRGGWRAWNKNHVGEAIELQNGVWENTGKCEVCGGTGRVPCEICNAKNKCERCNGNKKLRLWAPWRVIGRYLK